LPSTAPRGGDAWFSNTLFPETDLGPVEIGSYNYALLMHELGHSLGLEHSFQGGKFGQVPQDSLEYSVMSYGSYEGAKSWDALPNNFPQTLMMYDIAALQHMYGAKYDKVGHEVDTVYAWNPTTGEMSINDVPQGAPASNIIFMTIWDGGGTDTYDFSDYATKLVVDLNPGKWTNLSTQLADLGSGEVADGNIANALLHNGKILSLIENAIGGEGNDSIVGNVGNNELTGGDGDDTMNGDAGNDSFVFAEGFGNDKILQFDANPTDGQDLLDIREFGITRAAEFAIRVTKTVVAGDTLVTIDGVAEQTITLVGIADANTVTQDDFLLL
jgi:serralysin